MTSLGGWIQACLINDVLPNAGGCVKIEGRHIAVFNYNDGREWYAVDNICPHKKKSVLSKGIVGDEKGEPKVACPLHKNTFSLKTGKHLGGNEDFQLRTYPVKAQDGVVFLMLEGGQEDTGRPEAG
jgi:nitrite reductase (NADH) small subunit